MVRVQHRNLKKSKKNFFTSKNKKTKQIGGAAAAADVDKLANKVSLVSIKDTAMEIDETNFQSVYNNALKDIHFGYNPFANDGVVTFKYTQFFANQSHKVEYKYYKADTFIKMCKEKDLSLRLLRESCKEGYINSLVSMINAFYPGNTLPDKILYNIYIYAMYWEYGSDNNPVRIYLDSYYKERLDVPITEEMRLMFNVAQRDKDSFFIVGRNLSQVQPQSAFGRSRSSYGQSATAPNSNNRNNKNTSFEDEKQTLRAAAKSGEKELNRKYKMLALKYHPDKQSDEDKPKFVEKFREITELFTALKKQFRPY